MAVRLSRHFNNVMELYIIENYKDRYPQSKGSDLTDRLITDCLIEYGIEVPKVLRTARGKPYINLCGPVETHFSVSHSGNFFLCMIADIPVGIDVQEKRGVNMEKISERYFTEREKAYVKAHGEDGFFLIWTRKEAYSKLTGDGLAELIRKTEVLERDDVEFTDFQMEEGIWCSYCVNK